MPEANSPSSSPYHPDDASFLRYLITSRDYYVRTSNSWRRGMWFCQCMTVISTVVAGISSAAVSSGNWPYLKWVSVAASVFAAASLTISREFRVQQMTTLRDDGRREMDDILSYAFNSLLQHRESPEERFKIREAVRLRVFNLEIQQGQQWRLLHQQAGTQKEPE